MKFSARFKHNRTISMTAIFVLAAVIVVNILSNHWFWRLDLTRDQLYSTANVTKETIKNLPDKLTIKLYFSKDLPNQYLAVKQQVADLLADYNVYGKNFHYQFVDPGDGAEAEKAGIPKLQFNDVKHDKLEVVAGYMGLVMEYKNKREVIPVLQDTETLEYQLTSLMKKMTADTRAAVGLVVGHGTLSLSDDLRILNQALGKIYAIKEVDASRPVPAEIKTLLIVGAKDNFSDNELKNLDKFLSSDHSLIVLTDGSLAVTAPTVYNTVNKSNLLDFIGKYGLTTEKNLIADVYSCTAAFSQGYVTFNVNYPLWPKIIKENFEQTNPLVSHLDGVVLPWASSIAIDKSKIAVGSVVSELAKTTDQAWSLAPDATVDPTKRIAPTGRQRQFVMAAAVSGDINSVYNQGHGRQSRLIVIGDSDFIKDDFIQGDPNNLIFLQNLIDGATLDSGLAVIRSKGITARPIGNTTDQEKQTFSFLNIFGITVLVIVSGALRYYWRKKSKVMEL